MTNEDNKLQVEYAKVTFKGMVTIPASYRRKFNITNQDYLFFQDVGNGNIKLGKVDENLVVNGNGMQDGNSDNS